MCRRLSDVQKALSLLCLLPVKPGSWLLKFTKVCQLRCVTQTIASTGGTVCDYGTKANSRFEHSVSMAQG